jgi:hypothetical protein
MKHAFWQLVRGPEDIEGGSLNYIQGNAEHMAVLRAEAKGNEKRLARLDEWESQQEPRGYSWPSLGWWMSPEAYEKGDGGFGGSTKAGVEAEDDVTIHSTHEEAVEAWKKTQ